MSGSLRDFAKALASAIDSSEINDFDIQRIDIPSNLSDNISAYLGKHDEADTSDAQRLHDELVSVYKNHVKNDMAKLALFTNVLLEIGANLIACRDSLAYWAEIFLITALDSSGKYRIVVDSARQFLLMVMVHGSDDNDRFLKEREKLSAAVADLLVQIYIGRKKLHFSKQSHNDSTSGDFNDSERQVVVDHNAEILLRQFGQRRPKHFFNALDKYFVKPKYRILVLQLLCTFVQSQPPYLFETHSTELVSHLYQCLLLDRSTVAINIASTIFVILIPYFCSVLGPQLPRVFSVYSRLIYWDILYNKQNDEELSALPSLSDIAPDEPRPASSKDKKAADLRKFDHDDPYGGYYYYDDPDGKRLGPDTVIESKISTVAETEWQILEDSSEIEPTPVNYSKLFTFIYGTYPIQFLTFLTNPRRYFRIRGLELSDYIKYDIDDISLRSQNLSKRHLVHPNFFRYTFETEVTDPQRWDLAGTAEEIAAYCITLDTGNLEMPEIDEPAVIFRGFHDQVESTDQNPVYLSLDGNLPSEELKHHDDSVHSAPNELYAPDDLSSDSFLFASNDVSYDHPSGSESGSVHVSGSNQDDALLRRKSIVSIDGKVKSFTPLMASVSSFNNSIETTPASTGKLVQKSTSEDITAILENHKDINSGRIAPRRASTSDETSSSTMPQVSLHASHKRTPSSLSGSHSHAVSGDTVTEGVTSPLSRVSSRSERTEPKTELKTELRSPSLGPISSVRSQPLSPPVTSRVQNISSPLSYMQLGPARTISDPLILTVGLTEDSFNLHASGGKSGGKATGKTQLQRKLEILQRQNLMLRNELNFERYLKQLRLRNLRQVKEQFSTLVRDDANVQGLLLSNRMLQTKINRLQTEARKQHESLSRLATDRAKYSNQLLQKNRDLKAERETWKSEEESVRENLKMTKAEKETLKSKLIDRDAEIEALQRRLKDVSSAAAEVKELREKYASMQLVALDKYTKGHFGDNSADSQLTSDQSQIIKLQMKLSSAEKETEDLRRDYESKLSILEHQILDLKSKNKN
ncbi:Hamartin protein-domain-containing protein [Dipodascopsis uninucleata]